MWKHLETHRHRYSLGLFGIGLLWLLASYAPGAATTSHLRPFIEFAALAAVAIFYYVSGVPGLFQGLTFLGLATGCLLVAALPHLVPLELLSLAPDFAYATAIILFVLLSFLLRLPRRVRAWAARLVYPENAAARRHERQRLIAEAAMPGPAEAPAEPGAESASEPQTQPGAEPAGESQPQPGAEPAGESQPQPGAEPAGESQTQRGAEPANLRSEPSSSESCHSNATPYRQVGQYKQALLDSFRSWSLANALPFMRWIRGIVALALAIGGVACIYLAMGQNQPGVNFFRSHRFALLFTGIAILFYAAGIIGLGLLRGLTLPGVAALIFYSLLGVIRIEGAMSHRPLVLRAAVALIFLALYGLLVYFLIRGFRQRHDLFNWVYQLGPRIVGVDIALKDLLPIADYDVRIDAVLTLNATFEDERLRQKALDVATWYQHRMNVRKILPVGFVFEPETHRLSLHAYCRLEDAHDSVGFCERILSLQGIPAQVEQQGDPQWTLYREHLFPDAVTLHEIVNVQQLDLLDDEGVDLQAMHPIRIELRFPDCADREAAQAKLTEAGYAAVTDESMDMRERIERENTPDYCLAFIELNTRLGLERINTITGSIICLIEPYAGDLFGWELIAPADADMFDSP